MFTGSTGTATVTRIGSQWDIEIGGLAVFTEFDQMVVNGTAAIQGDLDSSLIDGFMPEDDFGGLFKKFCHLDNTGLSLKPPYVSFGKLLWGNLKKLQL